MTAQTNDPLDPLTRCDNCGAENPRTRLVWPIPDVHERVGTGEPMPAGECPDCGALAHLVPQTLDRIGRIDRALHDYTHRASARCGAELVDFLTDLRHWCAATGADLSFIAQVSQLHFNAERARAERDQ